MSSEVDADAEGVAEGWWGCDWIAEQSFYLASHLTTPVCKARESLHTAWLYDKLYPSATNLEVALQRANLAMRVIAYSIFGAVTAGPGIALRRFGNVIQNHPYIFTLGNADAKVLPADRTFSVMFWNICGARAGYNYTDGGLSNLEDRIEDIIDEIIKEDKDVVGLCEMNDTTLNARVVERLKKHYRYIYWNVGKKGFGSPSGLAVFSKYEIKNPEFVRFDNETLAGRTKDHCIKGTFFGELASEGEIFARVGFTHPQHSEEPQFPDEEELTGRAAQMRTLFNHAVHKVEQLPTLIMGDFNCDDEEFDKYDYWFEKFETQREWVKDGVKQYTWLGDQLCVEYVNWQPITKMAHTLFNWIAPTFNWEEKKIIPKRVSEPCNLDRALWNKLLKKVDYKLGKEKFDRTKFSRVGAKGVFSDHRRLIFTGRANVAGG
ncbi:MAG: endonuclease/exonuclease/phosphatase family protein [Candidatus Algichlamydia australiensis]|nr:endonuclease/exonuclease/phosphatase family protein [Chlamydiales bacterium]